MLKKITEKFKGDRKYFSIVFFVLLFTGISGIITQSVVNDTRDNWEEVIIEKINDSEKIVRNEFNKKQNDLISNLNLARKDLRKSLTPENESYKELIKLINDKIFDNYSIEIFAPNGKLIAWNQSIAIKQDELFPLNFPLGETYFLSTDLITYLSIIDTAHLQSDIFYLAISIPIEKKYKLNNQYSGEVSFSNQLSERLQSDVVIDYNPYTDKSKDGRRFSFELVNNRDKKIGMVTFTKPLLNQSLAFIKDNASKIQSLLVVIAVLFFGIGLSSDFRKLQSLFVRFLLLLLYLEAIRAILFVIGFPTSFITGELSNPSNFSSAFGWGIVKSPIEFFTTNLFLVVIGIQIFRYSRKYLYSNKVIKYRFIGFAVSLLLMILLFLVFRGLSAAIRSVVFDSTIRYFKEPNILPDFVSLVMNFNILLLGFASVLLIISLMNLTVKFLNIDTNNIKKIKLVYVFLVITLVTFASYYAGKNPLITQFMLMIFLLLVFVLFYQIIIKNRSSLYNYLFVLLIGSVISISLLNYFNSELERESLKTTALEINRTDSNFITFMLDETLRNIQNRENIVQTFGNRYTNFDALAFIIWGESAMQRESVNSGLRFYDRFENIIGDYSIGLKPEENLLSYLNGDDEISIVEINLDGAEPQKYYAGIIRIKERGIVKGYAAAYASFEINSIGSTSFPDFVESDLSILNRVIDVKQLKIFQFNDSKLTHVYGDIYPSRDQIKQILQTEIDSIYNDAWLKLKFDNEIYETYLLKNTIDNLDLITSISVAEKAFSWNLFNFFKIFIVHSLFIIIAFVLILVSRFGKISISFKSKLLFAFLIISIIPVIVLAFYNTNIVGDRSEEEIFNELSQRTNYVEKHLATQLQKNKSRDIQTACQNAARELGISFSMYLGTDQVYNSQEIYNRIGYFNTKLNSQAYYYLNYLRYKEYVTSEKADRYVYDAYYRLIKLNDKDYILSVNDAFNKIKISFSTTEINVVIFGIYSFAVIIIIIISTFFANQISQPIQRLTEAADAVGKGDLNVKIEHKERGELKELLDGFNQMTSELKKNQIELAEMEREAAWKEMAKQVAHEIKNPLTPMKLALQQLMISYKDRSKDFDKLFEKVSQTVLNQIDNLNQIASEFSRFAKMPSLHLEVVDLISAINDTTAMFVHEKMAIKIKTKLSDALIEADSSQLRRMFINLIRNSMQANAKEISIEIQKVEESYKVLFTDDGNGIKDSDKEKIFDENYSTKKHGMGLGLSLAKRFMNSIKGDIKLNATSGQGSVFEITFPVVGKFKNA